MSFLSALANLAHGVERQINPFDGGATYSNPNPIQARQQIAARASSLVNNINGQAGIPQQTPVRFNNVSAHPQISIQSTPMNYSNPATAALHEAGNIGNGLVVQPAMNLGVRPLRGTYDAVRLGAAKLTGNQVAAQNATNQLKQDYQGAGQMAQGFARTIPELATTIGAMHDQNITYHPNSPIERTLFGSTPIQNIQAKVRDTQSKYGTAVGIGEGALSLAQDIPVATGLLKGGLKGADKVTKPVTNDVKNTFSTPAGARANQNGIPTEMGGVKLPGGGKEPTPPEPTGSSKVPKPNETTPQQSKTPQNAPGETLPISQPTNGTKGLINYFKNPPADRASSYLQSQGVDKATANKTIQNMGDKEFKALVNKADAASTPSGPVQPPVEPPINPQSTPPEPTPAEVVKKERAGTTRINKAMGTDLAPSEYTVRDQKTLRANSENAAKGNLDAFTGKVQKALAQTPGRLTDQQLSDAYLAAEKHAEAGNIDLSNEILSKTLVHDSRTAQALAARGMLTKQSPLGMQKMVLNALEKAKVPFEGDLKNNVNKIMEEIKSTAAGTPEREIAVRKLTDTVTQAIPRGKWRATAEFWRAMLISGPQTAGKVLISQPFTATQAYLKQFPAAAFDATRSTITGGPRTIAAAPFHGGAGLLQGLRDAKTKLTTNIDAPGSGGFTSSLEHALKSGAHQTVVERKIFATHGAIQKPAFEFTRDNTLARLGKAQAINQGLKGDARKAFIDNYVKNPPQDAYEHAILEGEKATNQQRTMFGSLSSKVQSAGGKDGSPGVGIVVAPITRVPGAVATNALYEYSGLKFAKTALYDGLVKRGKTPDFSRTIADDFGKAVVGAGGIGALGAILGATGNLTPAAADNSKQASLNKMQGKPNGSLRIPGTHVWLSLNAMGPVGIELAIGAGFGTGLKTGSGVGGAATQAVASGAQEVSKQPYLQGITGVGNAIQHPKQYAESFVNNLIGSTIPAFSSQIASGTDTNQRQVNYNSISDVLKSRIPGVRESIPAAPDFLGRQQPGLNPSGTIAGGILGTLDAFKPSTDRNTQDPSTQELQRLYNQLDPADSPTVSMEKRNLKINGQNIKLNDQQLTNYTQGVGVLVHQGISDLLSNPQYKGLSDTDKAAQIDKIIKAAKESQQIVQFNDKPKSISADARTFLAGGSPGKAISLGNAKDPLSRYQNALLAYQQQSKAGLLSPEKAFQTQKSLATLKVQSNYPQEVLDLYAFSKSDLNNFIQQNPDKQSLVSQVFQLDSQLANLKGTKTKFSGTVASKSGGGSRKSGTRVSKGTRSSTSGYSKISLSSPYRVSSGLTGLHSKVTKSTINSPRAIAYQGPKSPKVHLPKVSKKGRIA